MDARRKRFFTKCRERPATMAGAGGKLRVREDEEGGRAVPKGTCPKTGGCEKFVRTPKTKGAALAAPFVHPDVGTGQVSDGVSGALSLRHSGTPLEQFHGRNWSMCGPYESSTRSQSA